MQTYVGFRVKLEHDGDLPLIELKGLNICGLKCTAWLQPLTTQRPTDRSTNGMDAAAVPTSVRRPSFRSCCFARAADVRRRLFNGTNLAGLVEHQVGEAKYEACERA